MKGILHYSFDTASRLVTVSFDEAKIGIGEIVQKLKQGGYPVSGEPQWVR